MLTIVFAAVTSAVMWGAGGPEGLVARVAPDLVGRVEFRDLPAGDERFELFAEGDRVIVAANTLSAKCAGFGHYYRHILGREYFWEGANGSGAAVLPTNRITRVAPTKWRVNFNFCTISYSLAFASWERWQRELDMLAMHGANLVLSPVGFENVWYETLRKLGWSEEEARDFLVGPPFQAWQWMTNMESENDRVTAAYLAQRLKLGRLIIARQLELGMTPMQLGFTGCVPNLARKKFPQARIALKQNWFGHRPSPAQLDPTDPLFDKFAQTFYATQKALFGAHGFYAVDPFHEGKPPVAGEDYLRQVGERVSGALRAADPKGVGCMQAWSLRMPIAKAFPEGSLMILDISGKSAAKFKGFEGIPFVSGLIWNFGGRTHSGGDLRKLAENPFAQARKQYANCVGAGLFPEGIHTSPLYFALAYDLWWEPGAVEPEAWLAEYLDARYGAGSGKKVARQFLGTLYSGVPGATGSIFCARPHLGTSKSDPNIGFAFTTNGWGLVELARQLLTLAEPMKDKLPRGLNYDIVDTIRAFSAGLGFGLYAEVLDAAQARELEALKARAERFLMLMDELDALLAHEPLMNFDVDRAQAGEWAKNETLLLTQWGPYLKPSFYDYAWREWSGLMRGYYAVRWRMFLETLIKAVESDDQTALAELNPKLDAWKRPAWRANAFYARMADFEERFVAQGGKCAAPVVQSENLVDAARQFVDRWEGDARRLFKGNPLDRLSHREALGGVEAGGRLE